MYICVLQQYDSLKKKGDDLYRARKYREAVDEYSSAIICWYAEFPKCFTEMYQVCLLSYLWSVYRLKFPAFQRQLSELELDGTKIKHSDNRKFGSIIIMV